MFLGFILLLLTNLSLKIVFTFYKCKKLRLREVRPTAQREELDETAFEPRSSLTSKPVPFLM